MGYNDTLDRGARRVLLAQALLTVILAAGFGWLQDGPAGMAAGVGGLTTILITGWLAWRIRRAGDTRYPGAGMGVIFSSSVVRYALVVALLGTAIGVWQLPALPLLTTFAVTQFGFLAMFRRP